MIDTLDALDEQDGIIDQDSFLTRIAFKLDSGWAVSAYLLCPPYDLSGCVGYGTSRNGNGVDSDLRVNVVVLFRSAHAAERGENEMVDHFDRFYPSESVRIEDEFVVIHSTVETASRTGRSTPIDRNELQLTQADVEKQAQEQTKEIARESVSDGTVLVPTPTVIPRLSPNIAISTASPTPPIPNAKTPVPQQGLTTAPSLVEELKIVKQWDSPPEIVIDPSKSYSAVFELEKGGEV